MNSTEQTTRYTVVSNTLIDHGRNPAIAFDRDETVTRDELDALIRSINDLHGFGLSTDMTTYDDDGSLWWGDEMVAEVARIERLSTRPTQTAVATRIIERPDGSQDHLTSTATIVDGILDITVTSTTVREDGAIWNANVVDRDGGPVEPGDEDRLLELAESMLSDDDG